ncbi:MAG: ATP-binding protein [Atopobiaceae bacterium]|nr:ATP-binding protein [Atopobiaceae bacterium]
MERSILNELWAWKDSSRRKPLMLKGARQVGKTWTLKEFGHQAYDNLAYFSLEKRGVDTPSEWAEFFETTSDPHRLAANLSQASGMPIRPESTLLVLDEIQDCPAAIRSLKHFCEEAPEYHVATAGSLLGVALANEDGSFPVGKVTFMNMYPLTFTEYLRAVELNALADWITSIHVDTPIPEVVDSLLTDELQRYFAIGGMPEAISCWQETKNFADVDVVLSDLLDSYERDFAKHGGRNLYIRLSHVWNSLPIHLAQENKKFIYGQVRNGARARDYETAIEWLSNAGLALKITRSKGPSIPLASLDDEPAFKLYSLDVGVLRLMAGLPASLFGKPVGLFSQFKGGFAENYVAQSLWPQLKIAPRYWINDKPKHEVDFLVQLGDWVAPIEVRSGKNVRAISLRYYTRKFSNQTPLRVRISLRGLSLDDNMLNIPLYLADQATRLMKEAHP